MSINGKNGEILNLIMVCGIFVWYSLCVSVCMLTVSNATVSVRSGGLFWLKPIAMVCVVLCSWDGFF